MAARSGMGYIIEDLRGLTQAGTADWTTGTTSYFSDDVLQTILDKHAEPFVYQGMEVEDPYRVSDGTYQWKRYEIEDATYIEQTTGGTAVFYLQDNEGGTIAANLYSVDYRTGYVTFVTPLTIATPYYATGTYYDIYGAASDVWQMKANHAAAGFDFSTDNHSIKRSQVYAQFQKMADYYRSLSKGSAGGDVDMERKDTDA